MNRVLNRIRNLSDWGANKWLTSYRLNALRTAAYGLVHRDSTQLVLVLGCQRSGTTMLADVLSLSPRVHVYGEGDPRYFRWEGAPRLVPLNQVERRLAKERSQFTLLKPLCESQRAGEILEAFPTARVVWIYRNYHDCVRSHVQYYSQFHDGLNYVREMLKTDRLCWKNENLSKILLEVLASYSTRKLNLQTAYALYWLARNSVFEKVADDARVKLVRYERVLDDPTHSLGDIFDHCRVPFKARFASIIKKRTSQSGKSSLSEIEPNVANQCQAMLCSLDMREQLGSPCIDQDPAGPSSEITTPNKFVDQATCLA